ncbi:MAG: hypothetical protein KDJ99_08280, partial [Candidatus Competibacteraceae bacterium]|nr:hypothetical protein [Candidatus Competibacteraceae bacterium]
QNRREQKRQEAQRRNQLASLRRPLEQAVRKLEQQIEKSQQRLAELERELAAPELYESAHKTRLKTLLQEQGEQRRALDELENRWLELQEELETIAATAT